MAGSLAHRELSASVAVATGRLRLALATQKDEAAMRRLLRENPTQGTISLSFEREPNYFAGAGMAGAKDLSVVAYAGERLVCLGHCTTRNCWVGDGIKKVGYLGELRLDASVRGRFDIIRRGYEFFRDLQQADPADFYFTSIVSDNTRARRLLESGLRGLPRYEFVAELVTLVIPVSPNARSRNPPGLRRVPATRERVGEMVEFLNRPTVRHTLSTAWTQSQWIDLERHGLSLGDMHLLYKGDKMVGCGALWDQRGFRQTVIRGYTPAIGRTRPLLNLVAPLLGTPSLPAAGTELAHAFLSPFATETEAGALLPALISSFMPVAAKRGLEFITIGLSAADPRLPEVQKRFRNRVYRSRLYEVRWPGRTGAEGSSPKIPTTSLVLPEIALL